MTQTFSGKVDQQSEGNATLPGLETNKSTPNAPTMNTSQQKNPQERTQPENIGLLPGEVILHECFMHLEQLQSKNIEPTEGHLVTTNYKVYFFLPTTSIEYTHALSFSSNQ